MSSLIQLARARRASARSEDGVIALMTLLFSVTAGGMILIGLWGIAYISGAYNSLYAATQSASLSAVTATQPASENPGYDQLLFECGGRSEQGTVCTNGLAMRAAQQVFETAFAPDSAGTYNMSYTPNSPHGLGQIHLVDSDLRYSGVDEMNVYEVAVLPGAARQVCELPPGREVDFYINDPTLPSNLVVCWRMIEFGANFAPNYTSAVVVRSQVVIPAVPFCNQNFCPTITLNASSAASEAQPTAPSSYGDYFS